MQKWRPFLHPYTIPSPYHSRDSMGRKRAEAKRERETKERKRGRGEGRHKSSSTTAKISPKGRKTSRVNTREKAELLNLGVNQTREDQPFRSQRTTLLPLMRATHINAIQVPPTLCMHRIRLKSQFLFQLFSI